LAGADVSSTSGVFRTVLLAEPKTVPTLDTLSVSTGAISNPAPLKVNGATFTASVATVNGIACEPVTAQYCVNFSSRTAANNRLFLSDTATGTSSDPTNGTAYTGITDLASCGVLSGRPTITRIFNEATATVLAALATTLALMVGTTMPYSLLRHELRHVRHRKRRGPAYSGAVSVTPASLVLMLGQPLHHLPPRHHRLRPGNHRPGR